MNSFNSSYTDDNSINSADTSTIKEGHQMLGAMSLVYRSELYRAFQGWYEL